MIKSMRRPAPFIQRRHLAAVLVAAFFTLASTAPAFAKAPITLRAAADHTVQIGTAIGLPQLDNDPTYRALAGSQFNSVTPENAMKWDAIEPQRGVYTYAAADEIVAFARAHDQQVHGHTLVWHNQLPSWLTGGTFTAAELRVILRQHIISEVSHFRGKIYAWDVVNEPFNEDGTYRQTMWFQALGPSYIADALRWAHQADPQAKLYINDYNIEGINPKSTAMYNLVKSLRAQGVPVSGVGIQGHLGTQYGFPGDIAQNIQRFTHRLGVQVGITELDVRSILPVDATKLATQTDYYNRVVEACLADARCVNITVWGFTDKYSWVPSVFAGQGAADIYDENYVAKPAYFAILRDLLAARGH